MAAIKDVHDGVLTNWGLPFLGLGSTGELRVHNLVENSDRGLWSWAKAQPATYELPIPSVELQYPTGD